MRDQNEHYEKYKQSQIDLHAQQVGLVEGYSEQLGALAAEGEDKYRLFTEGIEAGAPDGIPAHERYNEYEAGRKQLVQQQNETYEEFRRRSLALQDSKEEEYAKYQQSVNSLAPASGDGLSVMVPEGTSVTDDISALRAENARLKALLASGQHQLFLAPTPAPTDPGPPGAAPSYVPPPLIHRSRYRRRLLPLLTACRTSFSPSGTGSSMNSASFTMIFKRSMTS